jgi:RNase P protein component
MSSIALGAAFAAVQLVYQAYSKVKTSKARCARLVERCQFIVDRLECIATTTTTTSGDAVVRERIRELERWVCRKPY